MPRLTQSSRADIRAKLRKALLPNETAELDRLRLKAYDAAIADFYGTAGLKRIATLPPVWLSEVKRVQVQIGDDYPRTIHGPARLLPKEPPFDRSLGAAAAAACLAFFRAAKEADAQARRIDYEIDRVLDRATTLEALLQAMPAARDIIGLPAAGSPEEIAAKLNATLAAQAPAARPAAKAPPAQPRPRKPAAKAA